MNHIHFKVLAAFYSVFEVSSYLLNDLVQHSLCRHHDIPYSQNAPLETSIHSASRSSNPSHIQCHASQVHINQPLYHTHQHFCLPTKCSAPLSKFHLSNSHSAPHYNTGKQHQDNSDPLSHSISLTPQILNHTSNSGISLTNVQFTRSPHDRSIVILGGAASELVAWVARGLRFIAALTAREELGRDSGGEYWCCR